MLTVDQMVLLSRRILQMVEESGVALVDQFDLCEMRLRIIEGKDIEECKRLEYILWSTSYLPTGETKFLPERASAMFLLALSSICMVVFAESDYSRLEYYRNFERRIYKTINLLHDKQEDDDEGQIITKEMIRDFNE